MAIEWWSNRRRCTRSQTSRPQYTRCARGSPDHRPKIANGHWKAPVLKRWTSDEHTGELQLRIQSRTCTNRLRVDNLLESRKKPYKSCTKVKREPYECRTKAVREAPKEEVVKAGVFSGKKCFVSSNFKWETESCSEIAVLGLVRWTR